MPRVLIAGYCSLPGPHRAGVQLGHVVRALVAHHTVDVLVVRSDEQAYVERLDGARVLRVPITEVDERARIEAFRRAVKRQLEGADYDIVHARDGWAGTVVLALREQLRYAMVFDAARAARSEPTGADDALAEELASADEQCLAAADLVLVGTEAARRWVATRARAERVFLAPPGVDVDAFDWDDAPATEVPEILYAGALEPESGIGLLLHAVAELRQVLPCRLRLVGSVSSQLAPELERLIATLELVEAVAVDGAVEHAQVAGLIARASVCVAPAAAGLDAPPTTLLPTKILEYMACRRAVAAPRRQAVTTFFQHGVHALLFAPDDASELARALARLLNEPSLREALAAAGYERVRQSHTASATRRCIRRAYRGLAVQSPWRERFARAVADESVDEFSMVSDDWIGSTESHPMLAPISATVLRPSTDTTNVDAVPGLRAPSQTPWTGPTPTPTPTPTDPPEHWVVNGDTRGGRSSPDDDGTPVDVAAITQTTPPIEARAPLENRFVAGELEVRPVEVRDPDEVAFTAVSVLLGSYEEQPRGSRGGSRGDDES